VVRPPDRRLSRPARGGRPPSAAASDTRAPNGRATAIPIAAVPTPWKAAAGGWSVARVARPGPAGFTALV